MRTISTEKYNIHTGEDCLSRMESLVVNGKYSGIFILADEKTKKHCLPVLKKASAFHGHTLVVIKSGEKNKTIRSCEKIWTALSKQNADRKTLLVNLGGGVICDIGGFCASAYKRGIDFINIPTTLLSQVDASVGGKTGIDFLGYKNQIGTFAFPKAVFIHPGFLKTLPTRELISGFAEVIKHGLIADKGYWKTVKGIKNVRDITQNVIEHSVGIKNDIVTKDPYESGIRKALNFGHTIGHAVETALMKTKKPLLHGEAIAIGMICETYLSRKVCGLKNEEMDEINSYIISVFHPKPVKTPLKQLVGLMKQDKKNKGSEINFTLLHSIGEAGINNSCTEELIEESIRFFNSTC